MSTIAKDRRSNPKEVSLQRKKRISEVILLLSHCQICFSCSCFSCVFWAWCRTFADRPAAGSVSAGGRTEPLPADCGHQPDPGPGCTGGRLHGSAASHGGETAGLQTAVLHCLKTITLHSYMLLHVQCLVLSLANTCFLGSYLTRPLTSYFTTQNRMFAFHVNII